MRNIAALCMGVYACLVVYWYMRLVFWYRYSHSHKSCGAMRLLLWYGVSTTLADDSHKLASTLYYFLPQIFIVYIHLQPRFRSFFDQERTPRASELPVERSAPLLHQVLLLPSNVGPESVKGGCNTKMGGPTVIFRPPGS